jgi:hypothetical protein
MDDLQCYYYQPEEERGAAVATGVTAAVLRVCACMWSLCLLAFHVVAVWALVEANRSAVFEACGHSLWVFVLVHLLLPVAVACVACCVLLSLYVVLSGLRVSLQWHFAWLFGATLVGVVYYAVLTTLGVAFTLEAMRSEGCRVALGGPLLGIVGWIYVGLDSLSLLVGVGVLGALAYVQVWVQ